MKITDLKVVYICPDHNEKYHKRKEHMDEMLTKLGFKDFVHFKSGNEKYPLCLTTAYKTILQTYLDEPVLILEDDVEFTGQEEFDFIPEADAIYFGLSGLGINVKDGFSIHLLNFHYYSTNQVRITNMLSGTAILFISKRYKEACIEEFAKAENNYAHDIAFSLIQPYFFILANKKPSFYQSLRWNTEHIGNPQNPQSQTDLIILDDLSTTFDTSVEKHERVLRELGLKN